MPVGREEGCDAVHILHAIQQKHFTPVAAWMSSRSVPFQAPLSHTLRPSPQSVAIFSLVCSPNPKFHSPVFHTGQCVSQAWVHRAVAQTLCVAVALSCLLQMGHCPLLEAPEAPLSQRICLLVRSLSRTQESLLSFKSAQEHRANLTFSPFFSFFLSSFLVTQGSFLSFYVFEILGQFS